ncbi:meiosis-specific nuclear structural protein 1-like [Argiope bruennichi]|uniref:meiosis-specific nuclear structural protein 1-like n=1 Tax=Argiope bruennichi TaxID=94029 RepID=UPI00249577E0|nr:meiosis-specific nuclear structural protein 1-like [Argiope bruennichi]
MLELFKEQERQLRLKEESVQRKRDAAMQECYEDYKKKEKFNEHILQGEKIRNELKGSAQMLQNRKCMQNVKLSEESLGKHLGEIKLNNQREEKLRQLLWETSPELKELRQKILLANVAKDHAMQMAEKQALLELKRQEEESLAEAARLEKVAMEEEERKKEMEEFQAKLQYHRDLDELRHFKLKKDSAHEEQLERERKAIDDIKRQIEKEDLEHAKKKIEAQKELQRQAQELQIERDKIRLQEKLKERAVDLKVDEYRKAQELRVKQLEEKKQLSLEQKLQLQEELLSYLEKIYSEKLKKEHLRTDLAVEEKDAKEKAKELEAESKRMKLRKELQRLYDMQLYVKKQKQELQKKEEELYRQSLMARLFEEDKLELMSQQKQRQKKLEHMRIAQAMIEESRKKKAAERARELADLKYHEDVESERIRMVKEEKIRFLKECASDLLGYLPKGIFENDETIEQLGDEFKKFYFRQSCSK